MTKTTDSPTPGRGLRRAVPALGYVRGGTRRGSFGRNSMFLDPRAGPSSRRVRLRRDDLGLSPGGRMRAGPGLTTPLRFVHSIDSGLTVTVWGL